MATRVDSLQDRRVNLYEILQVSSAACPEVVQAAYRALARAYHPDVNPSPDAARQMRQLNAAYGVLSDPTRRARYDAMRIRPMRARRPVAADPTAAPTTTAEPTGRPMSRPAYVRDLPTAVISPMGRPPGLRLGRLLAALLSVFLFISFLVYGVYWIAGVLEDEPIRGMVPSSVDMSQFTDAPPAPPLSVPADILSSALSHVGDNSIKSGR